MKWEYWVQILVFPFEAQQRLQTALNQAGANGWELVSTSQNVEDFSYTLFYKRQLHS
jgi:hypothetical protein